MKTGVLLMARSAERVLCALCDRPCNPYGIASCSTALGIYCTVDHARQGWREAAEAATERLAREAARMMFGIQIPSTPTSAA